MIWDLQIKNIVFIIKFSHFYLEIIKIIVYNIMEELGWESCIPIWVYLSISGKTNQFKTK